MKQKQDDQFIGVLSSPVLYCTGLLILIGCTEQTPSPQAMKRGESLAIQHCTGCHQFVKPDALPTQIWAESVLPHMGHRLGIYGGAKAPDSIFNSGLSRLQAASHGIYPEEALLSRGEWQAILDYYLISSTDSISIEPPEVISRELSIFIPRESSYTRRPPLTSMIKMLPNAQGLMMGDGKSNVSALITLDTELTLQHQIFTENSAIQLHPLEEGALLLTIGKNIYPSDLRSGQLERIYKEGGSEQYNRSDLLIDSLRRPIHFSVDDLDHDGISDYVICEFGNHLGELSYYQSDGLNLQKQILIHRPGAVKTELTDLNNDGWTDIVTLMAQGQEEIVTLINHQGNFESGESWLSFSPLHGSTYFELIDWNGDGHLDILYTCGDNADITPIVKPYHGIYIYLNDGQNEFEQSYFYAMPGAYKALAHDYDLDGDLDIAAISFFPDYSATQPISFVYLDQKGPLEFVASTFRQSEAGRWITMDAADFDLDGDIDIALGSFVGFFPDGGDQALYDRWIRMGPGLILLENQMKDSKLTE